MRYFFSLLTSLFLILPISSGELSSALDQNLNGVMTKVTDWRHYFHQYPELSNREFKTQKSISEALIEMGLEPNTSYGKTGVTAFIRGQNPGPLIALRADIDGLPVTEKLNLPFSSKERTNYQGNDVGVMHACGHDAHIATLLGVASFLSQNTDKLDGDILLIFQPAEEGPPGDEEGGAELMLKEGIFAGPDRPGAVFGLHVFPGPTGSIMYRPNGFMAASDYLEINVAGVQTHGSMPWHGVDPIASAAQVINSLQTVVSRQMDISKAPAVVTIGTIAGGNRGNIISDGVRMTGTIRTLDPGMQLEIHERIRNTATAAAATMGATADVMIDVGYPVTVNDPKLTQEMAGILDWAANGEASVVPPIMGAEDFSYLAMEIPGLYFALGVLPEAGDDRVVGVNHSPYFYVNDRALPVGVRALSGLALNWLSARAPK